MRKNTFALILLICAPLMGIAQSTLSLSITGYDAKCNGSTTGSAKATVTGGVAPYAYVWSPVAGTTDSIGGLTPGPYSVLVTDSIGDSIRGSITITQPAPLVVTLDSNIVPPCLRTTGGVCGCENTLWAIVSGGTAPYSYLWTPGSIAGDTGDTLYQACYEDFTVAVTDNNGCTTSDSLVVVVPSYGNQIFQTSAVAQVSNSGGISIYPNPASGALNIAIDQPSGIAGSLTIYTIMGQKLLEQSLSGSERFLSLDISGFADGNYLLSISSDGAQKITRFSVVK